MTEDGKNKTPAAEADKAFNGPMDAPTSGRDGDYFWIRQRMPAEKTFPKGFEYVLMGVVKTPGKVKMETAENQTGLGTPVANQPMLIRGWEGVPRPAISAAPGAAATATCSAGDDGKIETLVYAAYPKKGGDGFYHVIPSMEEERWGWSPQFSKNKDVTSSLCLFKWALTRDATQVLGVDADLRKQWREVATHLAPYATWPTPGGLEYANQPGVEPMRLNGDHSGERVLELAITKG